MIMNNDKNPCFTFDAKTTESWTYKLTEEEKARFEHLPTPCAVIGFKPKNINSGAYLEDMLIRADMKRKAKVEFENNLWKQRFEALNGFPVEEGLGKENIIMPFSENDYLEKHNNNKVTK